MSGQPIVRRKIAPRHKYAVRQELNSLLMAEIIISETFAWSFIVVIAIKKYGKPRCCVLYRVLKLRTKADRFLLPKIQ